jgi:hypothetical protein
MIGFSKEFNKAVQVLKKETSNSCETMKRRVDK